MIILSVFLISAVSFGLGWWMAYVNLKEERQEIKKACDDALAIMEPIVNKILEKQS